MGKTFLTNERGREGHTLQWKLTFGKVHCLLAPLLIILHPFMSTLVLLFKLNQLPKLAVPFLLRSGIQYHTLYTVCDYHAYLLYGNIVWH